MCFHYSRLAVFRASSLKIMGLGIYVLELRARLVDLRCFGVGRLPSITLSPFDQFNPTLDAQSYMTSLSKMQRHRGVKL